LSSLLPLFPLDVVLFPGIPLPLHIFEPRYREMIAECLEQQAAFGVIRAQENGMADAGCTAEIVAVPKRYEDGRLDIVTEGRRRFEVMELNQERSFLRAEVLFFEDDTGKAAAGDVARALQLHGEILALAGAKQDIPEDPDLLLSFYLAGSLPLDLDFKQKLLSMRSESERLQVVTQYLDTILPRLQRAVHTQRKAGGNGHAH
jgi:Lon protease-like protein